MSRRYRIERELGRGGMGIVYQAFDLERCALVALKALTHSDALHIYRLKNEFRQLSDLSHPNLVSLYELTFDGEHWFFTMELIEGLPFDAYVATSDGGGQRRSSRSLPETVVGRARLLRDSSVTLSQPGIASQFHLPRTPCDLTRLRSALPQLIAAIAALHDTGKLHRDIKPSNVLVTEDGRVVVLDFGLVSNSTRVETEAQDPEKTIGGTGFGTPAYMSPEQANGEPITPASDWYSVGCVLYEALTGQLPFDGTVLQILKQKEEQVPPRPSELVSGIPDDLDQLCAALLKRQPEERPTGAQITRWFAGSTLPPPLRDAPPENRAELFIGREPHLAVLAEAFARSKSGKRAVVFVHGYSGMGKSALVRCFANDLIREGQALVLRGRCYERESVPYKAFDDIVDSLSRYMMRLPSEEAAELLPRNIHSLARLFPVLNRVRAVLHAHRPLNPATDPLELRSQAFGAFKDLLLRLSDWQQVVINIDDLQWADMDSARLLSQLFNPPDAPPVLFVGVYRREEADTSAFVRHVLDDPALNANDTLHLEVEPLAGDEAVQLADQLLHDQAIEHSGLANAIAEESEGVPFFIGELTRHVHAYMDAETTPTVVSLAQVIRTRLQTLSSGAAQLLQVLCVAARPIEQGVALEAARLPTSDRAAFQELRAVRMVRTRGTRQTDFAEPYHDRVREALVSELPPQAIREIHARLAEASERWGVGEPEQLVVHYAEAGEGGRAGETAIQAARAAADKLAFDRAADLYEKALELLPVQDQLRRQELLVKLADALAHTGRNAQSAEVYLRAARELADEDAQPLARIAAQQLLACGRFEAGTALTIELLAAVGCNYPETPAKLSIAYAWTRSRLAMRGLGYVKRTTPQPPQVVSLLQTLGLFRELQAYDSHMAAWLQGRYLLAALDAGDEVALLDALNWECVHLSMQLHPANQKRARAVLDLAQQVAQKVNTPWAQAKYQTALAGYLLFAKGLYQDAYEAAALGESLLQSHCPGHVWDQTWLARLKYLSLEFGGDLSLLLRSVPQIARDNAGREDRHLLALLLHALPLVHLMQDDSESAHAFLAAQAKLLWTGFSSAHFLVMLRGADVLLYEARGVEALAWIRTHWPGLTRNAQFRDRPTRGAAFFAHGRAALLAYTETKDADLLDAVHRDSRALRRLGPGFIGLASVLDAQVALLKGHRSQARAHFESALQQLLQCQADRPVQYVRVRLGELVGDAGGRAMQRDAREALERQGIVDTERFTRMLLPISAAHA